MDDQELIARWQGGDSRAGMEFFRRHQNTVRRFFINQVPAADMEDLCQETWASFTKSLPSYRGECAPRTFLLRIARRRLIDYCRQKAPNFDPLESSVADVRPGPRSELGKRMESEALRQALRELPADLHLIINLYYWEEMSAREIAEVIEEQSGKELPEGTVRGRIRRAKELLQEAMERAGASREELERSLNGLRESMDERRKQPPSESGDDDGE